jgi:hypothetical protein
MRTSSSSAWRSPKSRLWTGICRPAQPRPATHEQRALAISVELDAIEPNRLRSLVQETIELHLPADQFAVLKAAEESEGDIITRLVGKIAQKRLR